MFSFNPAWYEKRASHGAYSTFRFVTQSLSVQPYTEVREGYIYALTHAFS
jgi:hypothetical protein